MRIAEAIKILTDILATSGDLEVVDLCAVDGQWALDRHRQFDVIAIPNEDGQGDTLMCAFMGTEMFCDCDEDEPRPRLALVKTENGNVED